MARAPPPDLQLLFSTISSKQSRGPAHFAVWDGRGRLECDVDTGARSESGMHNKVLDVCRQTAARLLFIWRFVFLNCLLFLKFKKKKKVHFVRQRHFLHKLADETGVVPIQPN